MNRAIHINSNVINFGIPFALLGALILLMKSSFLNGNDILNFAITADLLLTVPLVYFLLIRKSKIPKTTVIPANDNRTFSRYVFFTERKPNIFINFQNLGFTRN